MTEQKPIERDEHVELHVHVFGVRIERFAARVDYRVPEAMQEVMKLFPGAQVRHLLSVPLKNNVQSIMTSPQNEEAVVQTIENPKELIGALSVAMEKYGKDFPDEIRDAIKSFIQKKYNEL